MASTFTKRQSEIILAAGKILTRSGVSGLTTKNLAREMNFTESALYRHFSGKEQIIVAMLSYLAESIDSGHTMALKGLAAPEERFVALFRDHLSYFKENPFFAVAVFSDGLMDESTAINDTIRQIMQVKRKHLTPIVREGQEKGIFNPDIATEDLVHIVMGAIRLQMFKWRTADFQFDIEEQGERMIQSILTLIKTK